MNRKVFTLIGVLLLFSLAVFGQNKEVHVKFIQEKIKLDGYLNENVWKDVLPANHFWQYFPSDSVESEYQTEIKMLYDDKFLYVGIKVFSKGENYIVPSLKRDFRARGNDNISLMFDTFNDGSNAFFFGTNPYGVEREALISGGGSTSKGFNTSWDTKWESKTKVFKNYYISEMKIPFSAFKFREGETKWRFNSYKFDTQNNEWSTWMHIPQNQKIFNLAFMGDMIFEKPLGKSKTPIAIIPYGKAVFSKDFDIDNVNNSFAVGGDAKLPIGNSMNLDLTINPDFSQVEIDEQIVNLTRFEISLPEKRQFFIDNSDLFSDFGNGKSANPFFSRRIGIAKDKEGNRIENQLLAGLRLSGKLNDNLRLGVLNIQTAEDVENEISSNNNTVIALQQKLFSRSNVGFIFVNRQVTKDRDFILDSEKYNRVAGIDFNLASEDNKWTGKYYLHKSFTPNSGNADFSSGGFLEYNIRNWKTRFGTTYIGEDFQSDLGFVRRTDILRVDPSIEFISYPKNSKINTQKIILRTSSTWSPSFNFIKTDHEVDLAWNVRLQNQSSFEIALNNRYTYLFDDFDPTGSEDAIPLPGETGYTYSRIDFSYKSDLRKPFSFAARVDAGQFFNGKKYSFTNDLKMRIQPYFTASLRSSYNYISLPQPYPTASIWLIGSKLEFTFTKNLFWSTFIQYSSQEEYFGINSRLQWRFKPLSDFFIVYNDNYKTTPFSPRTRALILKFTYWINI